MTGVHTCHSTCLISETVEFTLIKFLSGGVDQIVSAGFNFGLCRFSVTSPLLEGEMYLTCVVRARLACIP